MATPSTDPADAARSLTFIGTATTLLWLGPFMLDLQRRHASRPA